MYDVGETSFQSLRHQPSTSLLPVRAWAAASAQSSRSCEQPGKLLSWKVKDAFLFLIGTFSSRLPSKVSLLPKVSFPALRSGTEWCQRPPCPAEPCPAGPGPPAPPSQAKPKAPPVPGRAGRGCGGFAEGSRPLLASPGRRPAGAPGAAMVDSTRDELFLYMISCFRPRLKQFIQVQPVLDRLPSLSAEDRDRVRAAAVQRGAAEGAEELLRAVERGPRGCGWVREFLLALEQGGCGLAACYASPSLSQLPSPEEEAEHDLCVQLLQLLHGTLVDRMRAVQVAQKCLEMGIFQDEDMERVSPGRALPHTLATPLAVGQVGSHKYKWHSKCKNEKGVPRLGGKAMMGPGKPMNC